MPLHAVRLSAACCTLRNGHQVPRGALRVSRLWVGSLWHWV